MTLHVLVEGTSERAFLEPWSRRLLPGHTVRVHPHQGKGSLPAVTAERPEPHRRGLLDQLPAKLRGFAASLDPDKDRVVVLVDADDEDPRDLIARIEKAAAAVGGPVTVLVRLAVEETEAFYLGDLKALGSAFPKADMTAARAYKPDSICGTWELFGRIVGDGGGNKVAWAEAMGKVVTIRPGASRSPSFRALLTGLIEIAPQPPEPKRPRSYRHPTRKTQDVGRRR